MYKYDGVSKSQYDLVNAVAPHRTVYTGGTFDLFHAGHVNLLRKCKEIGGEYGEVVVSLNTDEFVAEYKGAPPVMSYDNRAEVLESCRYVDRVIENTGGADSKPAISFAHPKFIVVGSDWVSRDYHSQMGFTQEWLDERGIVLIYVPYTEGVSTTSIKELVSSRRGVTIEQDKPCSLRPSEPR